MASGPEVLTLLSAGILLFLVMDPFGNIPFFAAALRSVPRERQRWVVLREHLVALGVLLFFLFFGRYFMELLQLERPALTTAGGLILFIIAIKMIFPVPEGVYGQAAVGEEPFIVPLAVPYLAGPSSAAMILLFTARDPAALQKWLLALLGAWAVSLAILLGAGGLSRLLGDRVILAVERLMGMILAVLAVQLTAAGVKEFLSA